MKRKKYKNQTSAQRAATLRNQHKGRVAMMKGLIFWMLRDPQRDSLLPGERRRLGNILFDLEHILKDWKSTL